MILLRSGNYSVYNNEICSLFEIRTEVPISQNDKKFMICYNSSLNLNFDGFKKHESENFLCKLFHFREIDNSFFAQTKGIYNHEIVNVFENKNNSNLLFVTSKNMENVGKNGFVNLGDYCGKDISFSELEKIWEERKPTDLGFPYPEALPKIQEIKLN